jgi:asparagine synthase (glutamine-hydrolysing)
MCGICGVIGRSDDEALTKIKVMLKSLAPRGPDGEGIFSAPHIIMGSRRLSIVDIKQGAQPLFNKDKSLVLVANAEIYNHIELRKTLEAQGHEFITGSDCEVILHLYKQYGNDCITHLRGMFAFALFDLKTDTVLLARDRLGEKPLYIYQQDKSFYFASELKCLTKSKAAPIEIDFDSLHEFFHYQYVPEPATMIRNIKNLPAGHALTIRGPAPILVKKG